MRSSWFRLCGVAVIGILSLAPSTFAGTVQTFDLAWSGAGFGNSASATGQITLDLSLAPNPADDSSSLWSSGAIQSLTVTVAGSGAGDGTWTLANLNEDTWWTGDGTLDWTRNLVGQATSSGSAWGTEDGYSGDFNLWFTGGPSGEFYFTLATTSGDLMGLTEFSPAGSAIPEPGSIVMLGSGMMLVLGGVLRRRRVAK
jgi:hypothetical protein